MEQPVEHGEVGVGLVLHHPDEVELEVREPGEAAGVAEEPELGAVRDEGVEVLGEVEVFLHERVRGKPRAARLAPLVEAVGVARDVDGEVADLLVAVADGVGLPVHHLAPLLHREPVAERVEEGHHPELPRLGRPRGVLGQPRLLALEHLPLEEHLAPRVRDLVLDAGAAAHPEARGVLVRGLALERLEHLGREDVALEGDRRVLHLDRRPF